MRPRPRPHTPAALLALLFALGAGAPAVAEQITVAPQGVYAEIDTRLAIDTLRTLQTGSPAQITAAMDAIKAAPERYAPPVFYALSHVLFDRGDRDDAAFWFYAGQLRARFDANRCADVSARQAVAGLNQTYGKPINQYTFKNIPKLEALIPRVVDWDRKTPHRYDHRWINLHGMGAMISGTGSPMQPPSLSLPADQWAPIAEKTRADYLEGFRQAMAQMKSRE